MELSREKSWSNGRMLQFLRLHYFIIFQNPVHCLQANFGYIDHAFFMKHSQTDIYISPSFPLFIISAHQPEAEPTNVAFKSSL